MDKDRVKGTIDDAAGRAKRQVGEWTGNTQTQADGAAQQVKGKVEKTWGNIKDAARNAQDEARNNNKDEEAVRHDEATRNPSSGQTVNRH